ncbi:MAG: outer membrane beta-barrel protein [Desulfuromonadaceae bacterium]|nr:outer membrane beta-barrel protein [Desulfuromonadaceae bacterium]
MKHLNKIFIILCLPLLMCASAEAQHSGPYVGLLDGGSMLAPAKTSDALGDFKMSFKPNIVASAVVGWDLEPGDPLGTGRVELEYSRRSNTLDTVKFVEGSFAGGGTVKSESLLLNFIGVYHDDTCVSPYAGFGAGAARIEASNLLVTGHLLSSGSDDVFAYQLVAGVDFRLTDHFSLDLGYRFFGSARPAFTEAGGKKLTMDYRSHNAVLGLRVGF